jgi:hypothetical protein
MFNPGEYYNHYILTYLQEEELHAGSPLVETLKNGTMRVTKRSVKEKYGTGKHVNLATTLKDPTILDRYRSAKSARQMPPDHDEVAALTDTPAPDRDALLDSVVTGPPGDAHATRYHHAIAKCSERVPKHR